uniref:DUF4220 domain-containing protein n=1 Tax=Leersia perrieri TaxID=77586 RepID=A0A0D9X486_9ORYZ
MAADGGRGPPLSGSSGELYSGMGWYVAYSGIGSYILGVLVLPHLNLKKEKYRKYFLNSTALLFISLTAHHLWNEWEIQMLVLLSFSLQVFLFLFSGIRKRSTSKILSTLLWLAYVSADSIAIFVLGHLSLHINGRTHGLVLFWAPFMLLHLGGQELITAFSMEDNMLWKRHLLNLTTQVGLAAYVVGKQWQGDKLLLAPMVLMFISGTIRYAGRISALMFAAKQTTPGSSLMQTKNFHSTFDLNEWIMKEMHTYEDLVYEANKNLTLCMGFLKDITPVKLWRTRYELGRGRYEIQDLLSKEHRVYVSYKLAELQLSIVYDYFYTKLGAHFKGEEQLNGWFPQLVTLGSTFSAFFLFAWADRRSLFNYNRAYIIVSYILLSGAFILEILSILTVISSFPGYCMVAPAVFRYPWLRTMFFSIVKRIHPEGKPQWSQKLAQYNLITGCIKQKRAAADNFLLKCIKRVIGMKPRNTTYVDVSHGVKKLVLDKLLQVGSRGSWDISKFTGEWAKLEVRNKLQLKRSSRNLLKVLLNDSIERMPVSLTDICFFLENKLGASSPSREPSRALSNYVMYLSAEHGILSGNDGHWALRNAKQFIIILLAGAQEIIIDSLKNFQDTLDHQGTVVRRVNAAITEVNNRAVIRSGVESILIRSGQLAKELLKIKEANDRWDIIINVWIEMLCYMAFHCGPSGFHANHLSKGGEFISHVKLLIWMYVANRLSEEYRRGVAENNMRESMNDHMRCPYIDCKNEKLWSEKKQVQTLLFISLTAHAEHLWNEWEIQMLVLEAFNLQNLEHTPMACICVCRLYRHLCPWPSFSPHQWPDPGACALLGAIYASSPWPARDDHHGVKKLVLDKLLQVGSRGAYPDNEWDISKFTGQWAKLELRSKLQLESSSRDLLKLLLSKSIENASFMSAVLTWHIVTDICFFQEDEELGSSSPSREPSRELSNYVMYLTAEHGILSGNDGHWLLRSAQAFIIFCLENFQDTLNYGSVVRQVYADAAITDLNNRLLGIRLEPLKHGKHILIRSCELAKELLMIKQTKNRWDIIINVWMEMLCYMAFHCGPGFHAKNLSKGGEFISHVELLMFNLTYSPPLKRDI